MRILLACLLSVAAANAVTATPSLFRVDPGSGDAAPPNLDPSARGAVVEYPVEIAVLDIASDYHDLRVAVPDSDPVVVPSQRFDPIAGFMITDDGEIIVDPDAAPSDISFYWYGAAEGGSEVSLYVHLGIASGSLVLPQGVFAIATTEDAPVLREIDLSLAPEPICGAPHSSKLGHGPSFVPSSFPGRARSDGTLRSKATDRVDVLVVYTAAAQALAGGQPEIYAVAGQGVSEVDMSFENSGVTTVRVRNVLPNGLPALLVNYDESPGISDPFDRFRAHRRWLRTNAQPISLRNTYEADLVVMLVGDVLGPCGVAYTQRFDCGVEDNPPAPGCDVGPDYSEFAFSVVAADCAATFRDFPHEVGHQFGMEHQPGVGTPIPGATSRTCGRTRISSAPRPLGSVPS